MKIGMSAFAWTSNFQSSHLQILPAMKQLGFDAVEIPMFDPDALPIDAIRRAFQANALDCTVCAILPSPINPISPDAELRKGSIDHLKRCVRAAVAVGAKLLGGPLCAPIGYLPPHRPTEDEWAWAVEAFQALRSDLDQANLQLSIEPVNRSETFFLRTGAEAAQLCDRIGDPRIGVTIDTFHANIEEPGIVGSIRALGPRLRHVHASENDRGLLGAGHVPFDAIASTLKEMKYQGYVTIEGFAYSADEKQSPGYLWASKDISPERLAGESIRYLSRLLAN